MKLSIIIALLLALVSSVVADLPCANQVSNSIAVSSDIVTATECTAKDYMRAEKLLDRDFKQISKQTTLLGLVEIDASINGVCSEHGTRHLRGHRLLQYYNWWASHSGM